MIGRIRPAGVKVALALALVLATAVGACATRQVPVFTATVQDAQRGPYAIELHDEAGVVASIGAADTTTSTLTFGAPALQRDPGLPDALLLTWAGSYCSTGARLTLRAVSPGYTLHVEGTGGSGGCPAAAAMRAVRIVTTTPLDPTTFTLTGGE